MPTIEPQHEELASIIRESVYERYGFDRGREIWKHKGLVTVGLPGKIPRTAAVTSSSETPSAARRKRGHAPASLS
jgi:hypothetical protein